MKRHAETPVQNLTLERKRSFRGAEKEGLAKPIIPFFPSKLNLCAAIPTRGRPVVADTLFQILSVIFIVPINDSKAFHRCITYLQFYFNLIILLIIIKSSITQIKNAQDSVRTS